ncbi:helix-turn-helix domain-containing protein [Haloimpatiens massiliensis]|uniref:helix-turn-helix domain-containing protein n=1 Tax=Haloimpatiens massiliensis TaxID=1658110 RepID=UPI000C85CA70|nr:helix-turn-helix transcriptional regulator [Haloimpatiens massiliensis]
MDKVIFMGERVMNTMLEQVNLNPYERPRYTKYEISNMVKSKRKIENLSTTEFAIKYGISEITLTQIEEARRSFNVSIYKACSKILNMPIIELLAFDKDKEICYRKEDVCSQQKVKSTIDLANTIFNEMVMQRKMNVRE